MTSPEYGLQTLQLPDATVPESRIASARAAQDKVQRLILNDQLNRAWKRKEVQGLVDGNPPYRPGKLKKMGRLDACNVNWGTADSYCEQASGIFWDLFSESPTNFILRTGYGNVDDQEIWSPKMTQHAHEVLNEDPRWQFVFLTSQKFMVLHGCGPLYFETPTSVMPRFIPSGDLKLDENAESEPSYWEFACILMNYKPHELYDFINPAEPAERQGWNPKYARWAIMNAVPLKQSTGMTRDWEYWQKQLKQGSGWGSDDANVIKVAWCYWKEFDGTITHALVEQETSTNPVYVKELATGDSGGSSSDLEAAKDHSVSYLYYRKGKYKSWRECIHPMYYDRGNGTHYSVTGLGIKMHGAMNYENKLRCNLADKAMSPKLLFRPSTDSHAEFSLNQLADYGILSAGWTFDQTGVAGQMNDGMAMLGELGRTVSNNLAQYRQSPNRSSGNPPTLGQVQYEAQQQYRVANTQVSRYYKQLDVLFDTVVRRLCLPGNSDPLAKEFRRRCKDDEIPPEALTEIVKVEANRVAGQGSAVLRQAALDKCMAMRGAFPEEGQELLLQLWTAAQLGQRGSQLICRKVHKDTTGTEQEAEAVLQTAAMRIGVAPVITGQQDPAVFASVFLGAAGQALGSIPQGANPAQVFQFIDLAAPAAHAHIDRLAQDPQKKDMAKRMMKMWEELAKTTDQMKEKIATEGPPQKPMNGQPQLPPDQAEKLAVERAKGQLKLQQMMMSHRQRLQQRKETHDMQRASAMQDVQLKTAAEDLKTAAEIRRGNLKSFGA